MQSADTTILITSFNEGKRLTATVAFFTQHFPNYPIMIVDDASDDNSSTQVSKQFPHVTVIHHHQNLGKSAAIVTGLTKIMTQYVCLFDADLSHLNAHQVRLGLEAIKKTHADMLVYAQQNDHLLWKLLNLHVYVSGERIIRTKILRSFFQAVTPQNYEVEIALHFWFYQQELKYLTTPLHSNNQLKLNKWDPLTALKKSWQFYSYFFVPKIFFRYAQLLNSRARFEKEIKKDHS